MAHAWKPRAIDTVDYDDGIDHTHQGGKNRNPFTDYCTGGNSLAKICSSFLAELTDRNHCAEWVENALVIWGETHWGEIGWAPLQELTGTFWSAEELA